MRQPKFCGNCGKPTEGKAFCAHCGAFIGMTTGGNTPAPMMLPVAPQPGPPPIVREYGNWKDRDRDIASMRHYDYVTTNQKELPGKRWQVAYVSRVAGVTPTVPSIAAPKKAGQGKRLVLVILGLVVLYAAWAGITGGAKYAGNKGDAAAAQPTTAAVKSSGPTWRGVPLYPSAVLYNNTSDQSSVYSSSDSTTTIDSWYRHEWNRAGMTYMTDLPQDNLTFHIYKTSSGTLYGYAVSQVATNTAGIAMILTK